MAFALYSLPRVWHDWRRAMRQPRSPIETFEVANETFLKLEWAWVI